MHVRQQIREAIAALLTVKGLTNVSTERVYSYSTSKVPAHSVYTSRNPEQAQPAENVLGKQARLLAVVIESRAKAAADVDDTLDDYAVAIEEAMAADATLGGLCVDSELAGTEIEILGESEKLVGVMRMTYDVLYRVNRLDPETSV